jgi:hypothetical protein
MQRDNDLLAVPLVRPLPGDLILVPTLVSSQASGRFVRVANLTNQDIVLQPRTHIALLQSFETVDDGTVTVDMCRLEVLVGADPLKADT